MDHRGKGKSELSLLIPKAEQMKERPFMPMHNPSLW